MTGVVSNWLLLKIILQQTQHQCFKFMFNIHVTVLFREVFIQVCAGSPLLHSDFSSCSTQGPSLAAVYAPPCEAFRATCTAQALCAWTAAAAALGLIAARGLVSCSTSCEILIPGQGIEPTSPVLTGRFLAPGPPGKSTVTVFDIQFWFLTNV